jgi:hypothetical protein
MQDCIEWAAWFFISVPKKIICQLDISRSIFRAFFRAIQRSFFPMARQQG